MATETPEGNGSWGWPERLSLLSHLSDKRSSQDQVLWSIFGAFWATNALLLVALFNNGSWPPDARILRIVGSVGMVTAVAWTVIQYKALGFMKAVEEAMKSIQAKYVPPDLSTGWPSAPPPKHLARIVMYVASIGSFLAWLAALLLL